MKQYLDLLQEIVSKGTMKTEARANMPGTTSLFGYQFRHNLADGFPLLTTKRLSFKNISVELLWFLRGDTNIKYLDENGCKKMWHEDAYNYYKRVACNETGDLSINNIYLDNHDGTYRLFTFEEFCEVIANTKRRDLPTYNNNGAYIYRLGDCGYQYGRVWRSWDKLLDDGKIVWVDQIDNLINGLMNNPMSRRHIITATDPGHDQDLALYWCHSMFQFNCRPLTHDERCTILSNHPTINTIVNTDERELDEAGIPKYYLDCQLYQRSGDVFLGVPYNIASYALLTMILAKVCNMVPGTYIHTFGDVHIYDNHMDQVMEQLTREPRALPKVKVNDWYKGIAGYSINDMIRTLDMGGFTLEDYNPHPTIKGDLSTGLIK